MDNSCLLDDIKMLYIRFATAYGSKFTSNHTSPEIIEFWYQEWKEALAGIDKELVIKSFNECKMQCIWPPSISEIIKSCDEKIGIPNVHEAINLIIQRKFSHPVVEKLYLKIGDWEFRNASAKSLLSKSKIFYPEILSNFRLERQRKFLALEHKLKEIPHGSEIARDHNKRNDL